MSSFCKNEDCPTSERLLAFQTGDIEPDEAREIRAHMTLCEFCEAEATFYSHYPPVEEKAEPGEMPEPLYELAAALLGGRKTASAEKFSHEIDRLYDENA